MAVLSRISTPRCFKIFWCKSSIFCSLMTIMLLYNLAKRRYKLLRNADILDLNFIHKLVLSGSQNEHFNPEFYLNQAANNGLRKNLQSILNDHKRLDLDAKAYVLIAENYGKPASFMIISAREGGKGNEIWMMGTDPQYQGKGIASSFLDDVLKQFKSGNRVVFARCSPISEVMFKLLIKKGFKHVETGESGTRLLAYNLPD